MLFNSYTAFINSPYLSLGKCNTFFLKEVSTKLPHSNNILHFFPDYTYIFKSRSLYHPTLYLCITPIISWTNM